MLHRFVTPNGIPVFIYETHFSPVVTIQNWVVRGSIHEPASVAGISHFLEHSLFKGTKTRKVGEIAKEIEGLGGETNAFTSFEQTAYYLTLTSKFFSQGLEILSDMMIHPSFEPDEIEKEKEVILEEIKRAYDSPFKLMSMNLWQKSFAGTPYGRPVLGFAETVRKINAKTLRQYFEKHYHTGTYCLFIVGDVDARRAFSQVCSAYKKCKRGVKPAPLKPFSAPTFRKPVSFSIQKDIQEFYGLISIPIPSVQNPKVPIFDILSSSLGQGESSILYQKLVKEKKLALDVGLSVSSTSHLGLWTLSLTASDQEKMEQSIVAAKSILDEKASEGVDEESINIVKQSLESDLIASKETVENYARRLGYFYCEFGNPESEKDYFQRLLSVTDEEATEELSNLLTQVPIGSFATPQGTPGITLSKLWSVTSKTKALKKVDKPIERRTLGSLPLLLKRAEGLPLISFRLLFLGGSREEDKTQLGIGNLFSRIWTSGTASYTSLELSKLLESLGASLHGFCGRNSMGLHVECLSKHWKILAPIVEEVLYNPSLPQEELHTEQNLILNEIKTEKDLPLPLCQLSFLEALYGDHPYGRPPQGTYEAVKNLTRDDLRAYHAKQLTSDRAVASVVGHFPSDHFASEIEKLLANLPHHSRTILPFQKTLPRVSKTLVFQKRPLQQAHLMIGFLGPSLFQKERIALKILSSCLQGQGGRLFLELRDKKSLAYTVTPLYLESPDPGYFGFYIGCSPEKWKESLVSIKQEIVKILEAPISGAELKRAKQYWLGRVDLDMQKIASQSLMFGLDELYGLGFENMEHLKQEVQKLTSSVIQEAAQRFLTVQSPTISLVHPDPIATDEVNTLWHQKTQGTTRLKGNRSSLRPLESSLN